ncbi:hypothetical protein [Jannaschia sp. R86511]|uniref:hypothetical protein n=1 Tax=Jannaschia sp. R86511 TaxID=3093853 RepID=UPI0036D2D184
MGAEQPTARPPEGRRWPVVVLAVAVVVLLGVTLGLLLNRQPSTDVTQPPAPPPTLGTPDTSQDDATVTGVARADGCLGGDDDLNQALLTAQEQAPISETGAAAFAATWVRWGNKLPRPEGEAALLEEVLAPGATDAARGDTEEPEGDFTLDANFAGGRYYVESFDSDQAVVTVLSGGSGTANGATSAPVELWGTYTLTSVNGRWHVQDATAARSVEDIRSLGVLYVGGC